MRLLDHLLSQVIAKVVFAPEPRRLGKKFNQPRDIKLRCRFTTDHDAMDDFGSPEGFLRIEEVTTFCAV